MLGGVGILAVGFVVHMICEEVYGMYTTREHVDICVEGLCVLDIKYGAYLDPQYV